MLKDLLVNPSRLVCRSATRTRFSEEHQSGIFHHGGPQPPLEVCGLSMLKVGHLNFFANLTADCHPITTKSRRYSYDDRKFIDAEAQRLLKEGIIEPSNSPW